jgi:cytochrome c553
MEKRKTIVLIIIVLIVMTTVAILFWSQAPKIPLDCSEAYANNTTCFGCHETGENDAPRFPSGHQEKIEDGYIADDIDSCLKCHKREE